MLHPTAHDKWIAAVVWFGLFAAIVVSSLTVISYDLTILNIMLTLANRAGRASSFVFRLSPLEIVAIVIVAIVTYLVMRTWSKFIIFTNEIMIGFARRESADNSPLFLYLLKFSSNIEDDQTEADDEEEEADPDSATGSLIADAIRPLMYAWGLGIFSIAGLYVLSLLGLG
jgi:hypothetical protein